MLANIKPSIWLQNTLYRPTRWALGTGVSVIVHDVEFGSMEAYKFWTERHPSGAGLLLLRASRRSCHAHRAALCTCNRAAVWSFGILAAHALRVALPGRTFHTRAAASIDSPSSAVPSQGQCPNVGSFRGRRHGLAPCKRRIYRPDSDGHANANPVRWSNGLHSSTTGTYEERVTHRRREYEADKSPPGIHPSWSAQGDCVRREPVRQQDPAT